MKEVPQIKIPTVSTKKGIEMKPIRLFLVSILFGSMFFIFESKLPAEPAPQGEGTSESTEAVEPPETSSEASSFPEEETVLEPPAPAPAPTTAPGNVSLDFKDADINNVLRILSLKSKVNIVTGPEVQGTVTIRLEDVPWEKALDVVLRTYGYVYERKDNIIRVTTKDNLATEELVTETFILNYTTSKEAEEAIKDILSERGRVKEVPRTNMLVVTDIPTNVYKIREVIRKLDKSTPQAYIDSKIVKTQIQEGENLGIKWTPGGTFTGAARPTTFPFQAFNADNNDERLGFFDRAFRPYFPGVVTADAANTLDNRSFPPTVVDVAAAGGSAFSTGTLSFASFSSVLEFLRTRQNTKVISNPRITVLNNQAAKIKVGTDVALPTFERNETTGSFEIAGYTYRETGVVMDVTPHINDADEILVDLKPEISETSGSTTFSSSTTASFTSIPNFAVTNASTQVLIKSGETIAIGGLMTDARDNTENKIPFFGDLPIVGKVFRSKRQAQGTSNQKAETLFFVTVTIVDTTGQPTRQLNIQSGSVVTGVGNDGMVVASNQPAISTANTPVASAG